MLKEKILGWVDGFIRPSAVGLDISDLSIKYFKFNADGEIDFDFFGEVAVPDGVIMEGEIKKEEELVRILTSWLAGEGRRLFSSWVVVSLPEEKSFLRLVQLPKVNPEELDKAIRWEIEATIPIPVEELIYDYEVIEPVEGSFNHFDIVLTAFPKAIVDSYVRLLKKVSLRPLTLELESQAIIRSVTTPLPDRSPRIVIDMGRNRTSFIIFSAGAIIYTTTIDLGGRTFEEHLASTLKVDGQKAVEIKKEIGLDKKAAEGKIFSALLPAVSRLEDELKRTVEYYRTHAQHSHRASETISEVLLIGGDANLYGLDTYLSSTIKVPVRRGDPLSGVGRRLKSLLPPLAKNQLLSFTTAIGLALRAAHPSVPK